MFLLHLNFPTNFNMLTQTSTLDVRRAQKLIASKLEAKIDAELVRRFKSGDESAFEEIMKKHRVRIFSAALTKMRNRADAEEIAQDVFVRAHRGLHDFRGDSSLTTWLHRIVFNLSSNRYWYWFRRKRHSMISMDMAINDSGGTLADIVPSDTPLPRNEVVTDEFTQLIMTCMERLSPSHKEILVLRNMLSQSYEEISKALGVNVGTVKSRIARARMNLKTHMEKSRPELFKNGKHTLLSR